MYHLGLQPSSFEREAMEDSFNNLWADNGDYLSKIYAGTGALKSSYTRKGKATVLGISISDIGFLNDAAKSVNRFYIQNFLDSGRQEAIDLLLGQGARTPSAVREENSKMSTITLYCGTYNFNGRLPGGESLESWLVSEKAGLADVVVIGCQELIKLTPGEVIEID